MKTLATLLLILLIPSQLITFERLPANGKGWQSFRVTISISSDVTFSVWFYYVDPERRSYLLLSGRADSPFCSTWHFVNFSCGRFAVVIMWRDGGYEMAGDSVELLPTDPL